MKAGWFFNYRGLWWKQTGCCQGEFDASWPQQHELSRGSHHERPIPRDCSGKGGHWESQAWSCQKFSHLCMIDQAARISNWKRSHLQCQIQIERCCWFIDLTKSSNLAGRTGFAAVKGTASAPWAKKYILLPSHHMMLKQQSRRICIRTLSGWGLLVCKKVVEGRRGSDSSFWCC